MIMEQKTVVGSVTLFEGTIRESVGAERKVVRECTTEDGRVESLQETFGIGLSKEEVNGIAPELKLA